MCGIVAVYDTIGEASPSRQSVLKDILEDAKHAMYHRGPDGNGQYMRKGIGLAMTRLTIVGGDDGQQPIWNENRSVVLVCNGEIYNHARLRHALESLGHQFSTTSDVEVIVHLYEEYREECLNHLEGIFAFALYDLNQKKLFVARDRCGVKPLYYTQIDGMWVCSSEFQFLLRRSETESLDPLGFAAYHKFRFTPAPDTIASGIKKLGSGEFAVLESSRFHTQKYWPEPRLLDAPSTHVPNRVKIHSLKSRLFEAVGSQATNAVKTGILLSGGLDSTALLGIHQQLFGEVPPTFTVSFAPPRESMPQREYSEFDAAREVAKTFLAHHTSERYTASQVLNELPQIIAALDEPVADPTAIPLWFAVRLAKNAGVKVLYSGEGLDELFAGYSVYRQVHWINALQLLPVKSRQWIRSVASRLGLPGRGVLDRSILPPSEWYQGVGGAFSTQDLQQIVLEHGDAQQLPDAQEYVRRAMAPVHHRSVLSQLSYFDLQAWLPENTLVKSDKISMAQSVELRVPFLNQSVVELALELDDRAKLHGRFDKWVVRRALKDVIPDSVIRRKKNGFPIPLTAWIFGEWKDFALSTLLDANSQTNDLYKREQVERLFHVTGNERRRAARLIWVLLSLELWHRHVRRPSASAARASSLVEYPSMMTVN